MSKIHVKTTLVVAVRDKKGEVIPGKTTEIAPGIYTMDATPLGDMDREELQALYEGGFIGPDDSERVERVEPETPAPDEPEA